MRAGPADLGRARKSATQENVMPVPTLLTLEAAAEMLQGVVSAKSLRREVYSGALKCLRARPGSSAKILVTEDELARWVREVCSKRQRAPSSRRSR